MLIDCSTGASEVVEKKIEKIIEKSSTDGILKKTNPSIPRGRNDFKSIAEKWQSIESSSVSSPAPSRPQLATPPSTTPSILSKPSAPSPVKSSISDLKFPPRENTIPQTVTRTPSGLSSSSRDDSARIMQAKLEAMEADKAWAAEKCKSESEPQQQRVTSTGSGAGTKRSVSVNDIRKAFEKAEIAVNSYNGREGGSPTEEGTGKNKDGGLTLPAAHFRVSSFDRYACCNSNTILSRIYDTLSHTWATRISIKARLILHSEIIIRTILTARQVRRAVPPHPPECTGPQTASLARPPRIHTAALRPWRPPPASFLHRLAQYFFTDKSSAVFHNHFTNLHFILVKHP